MLNDLLQKHLIFSFSTFSFSSSFFLLFHLLHRLSILYLILIFDLSSFFYYFILLLKLLHLDIILRSNSFDLTDLYSNLLQIFLNLKFFYLFASFINFLFSTSSPQIFTQFYSTPCAHNSIHLIFCLGLALPSIILYFCLIF